MFLLQLLESLEAKKDTMNAVTLLKYNFYFRHKILYYTIQFVFLLRHGARSVVSRMLSDKLGLFSKRRTYWDEFLNKTEKYCSI